MSESRDKMGENQENSFQLGNSAFQDQADDMSIHLKYELISDKLDVVPPSGPTGGITKATTKNIKDALQENSNLHSEEEKEPNKRAKKWATPVTIKNTDKKSSEGVESPLSSAKLQELDPSADDEEAKEEVSKLQMIMEYANNSSLFIFHKDSRFREFILPIVTTPEDIVVMKKAKENPERYGIMDLSGSQLLKSMNINQGKLLTSRSAKNLSKIFEYFIMTIILLSCIILCIDTPLNNPDTAFSKALAYFDIIFSIIFLIECILKIIALGFFWNQYQGVSCYFLNGWNFLDFVVVVVSCVDIYFSYLSSGSSDTESLNSFKSLRAIRALRPLRMISRNEGLKIAIQALIASVPAMGNVLIICLLFLLIFAILGVNFFKGAFYS